MSVFLQHYGAWAAAYAAVLSAAACILMGADKARSRRRGARRVPERTFFLLALLGGAPGAILGMTLFHHKTRHWYFVLGLPAILLLQLALLAWSVTR